MNFLKYKKNPVIAAVEVGHIGDVNWLEYGGGPVFRHEDGSYTLEYVEEPPDDIDFDDPKARWTIYRVALDQEVPNWGDINDVALTVGSTSRNLRADFLSDDPVRRATAYQDWAGYYGWNNFDDYPLVLTKTEVYRRYGEELELEN